MKNCYEVLCKGGHVGRGYYYPMSLFIMAEDAKEAAAVARKTPRVKHDHKDCILSVCIISREALLNGIQRNSEDGYYRSHSKQDMQRLCPDYLQWRVPERRAADKEELGAVRGAGVPLSHRDRKKYINHYVQPQNIVLPEDTV